MTMSALYSNNRLSIFYNAGSLKQQFAGKHVAPHGHSIPSRPVLVEKYLVWPDQDSIPWSITFVASTLTITTSMWSTNVFYWSWILFNYLAFQYLDIERSDEGYSRNASCALIFISTFLFYSYTIVYGVHILSNFSLVQEVDHT